MQRQRLLSGRGVDWRLAKFSRALRARDCDIVCIGDSHTEGIGATARNERWIDRWRNDLRARYGTVGGEGPGYVPAVYADATGTPNFTGGTIDGNSGLGLRNALYQFGGGGSFSFTGTGFDLFYLQSAGLGAFTWSVDFGAGTSVNTGTQNLEGGKVQVRGLTDAAHQLTWTQSGAVIAMEGIYVYRGDEARGIRLWDAGHSGFRIEEHYASYFNDQNGTSLTQQLNGVGPDGPDVVLVGSGPNDWLQNQSLSDYRARLTAVVDYATAAASRPNVVLLKSFQVGTGVGEGTAATWAQMRAAVDEVAATRPHCFVLDLDVPIPGGLTGGANASFNADNVHPNTLGHRVLANWASRAMRV